MCDSGCMPEKPPAPSGTVTFLFTDVEGSTRLWERDRGAMGTALGRHDEILRAAIGAHRGYVFSTAGDAFAAAFHEPADAAAAALDAQDGLEGEAWPEGMRIRVRMGLHAGTAQERDGDYFGPTLNRCARLMAIAHGGQIVLSSVMAGMLGDVHDVDDLGEHRLKDLAAPVQVFQLRRGIDNEAFPPLRSLTTGRDNLPIQSDAFIGRIDDVERVVTRLRDSRLVTLSALGGTGKTRLAMQVGAEISDGFADGVWLVEVDRATEATEVAAAIGRAVGFEVRGGSDWVTSAAEWLSVKEMLVILDNCEQVLDGVAEVVEAVLSSASEVRFLVTTREALRIRGESVIWLAPLDPSGEAVELFIERAERGDDRFEAEGSLAAIEELCQRLDGLPLAIELAAARVRTIGPEDMLGMLDRRFELLRSRERGGDERRRTLLGTVEWSYDQLPDTAKDLFNRLSVFGEPFGFDAVVAVAGARIDELEVLDLLDELESRNLIENRRDEGQTRYRLLETLASFAAQRLTASGLGEEVLELFARYFLDEAARSVDGIELVDVEALTLRFRFLIDHHSEIRRALVWAAEHEPETAVVVAHELLLLFNTVGDMRRASDIVRGLEDTLAAYDESGMMLSQAAMAHWGEGNVARMEQLANQVLDQASDSGARMMAHTVLAVVAIVWRNEPEAGIVHLDEAAQYHASTAPSSWAIFVLGGAAVQYYQAGRADRCREVFLTHVEPMRTAGALWDVAVMEAAADTWRFDDLAYCSELLQKAEDVAAHVGLRRAASFSRFHLALNARMSRDYESAFHGFRASLRGLLDEGEVLAGRLAMEDLGAVLARVGRMRESVIALGAGAAGLGEAQGADTYVRRRIKIRNDASATLGAAEADDRWSQGASMTFDEAVDWANSLEWDSSSSSHQ